MVLGELLTLFDIVHYGNNREREEVGETHVKIGRQEMGSRKTRGKPLSRTILVKTDFHDIDRI